jgi:hypothetical protein
MAEKSRELDMERERAKAGGYKVNWLLEELQFHHADAISDLETLLRVKVEPAELYRLIGHVILRLHKAEEAIQAIRRIYEKE